MCGSTVEGAEDVVSVGCTVTFWAQIIVRAGAAFVTCSNHILFAVVANDVGMNKLGVFHLIFALQRRLLKEGLHRLRRDTGNRLFWEGWQLRLKLNRLRCDTDDGFFWDGGWLRLLKRFRILW